MNDNHLRFKTLRRLQSQKKRLAERESSQCKMAHDHAMNALLALRAEYRRANDHYQQLLAYDPRSAHLFHESLVALGKRITEAAQFATQCECQLDEAVQRALHASIECEKFETLCAADLEKHLKRQSTRESATANEQILLRANRPGKEGHDD